MVVHSAASRVPVIILVFVLLKCLLGSISAQDGDGTKELSSDDDTSKKQFLLNNIVLLSWFQAYAHCRSLNMHLASVENEEEWKSLLNAIKRAQVHQSDYWLSGTDMGQPGGRFLWMSSGKPVSFAKWHTESGEPNHFNDGNNTEHCIALSWGFNYDFNDKFCEKDLLFHVCEY